MDAATLIYLPVAAAFAAFVVYGGIVMPAREVAESMRRRKTAPRDAGAVRDGKTAP
ncbi:hypothetical protein Arub01_37050 [Actinomadura rubrobrunea]|uniref:Uncharacterized protein n=1 Tax=Actinomadura rubrobrunea TaxID=115335 RepID=A0A9W6UV99_9ACTN|nr:hypothetical protein [Actinomadura rubrobrunea]GLW65461.1 hypothetical protein Arub01_37050 [Actinomadura rubrobrunea]